jgi:hypothetical protein
MTYILVHNGNVGHHLMVMHTNFYAQLLHSAAKLIQNASTTDLQHTKY